MDVTPHFWDGPDPTNVSRVQEDTRVPEATARGVDYRERLGAGPARVGDATAGLGVSKPAITKHVKVLEETGVLTRAVEGRTYCQSSSTCSARWQSGWIASGPSGAASWTSSTST